MLIETPAEANSKAPTQIIFNLVLKRLINKKINKRFELSFYLVLKFSKTSLWSVRFGFGSHLVIEISKWHIFGSQDLNLIFTRFLPFEIFFEGWNWFLIGLWIYRMKNYIKFSNSFKKCITTKSSLAYVHYHHVIIPLG